MGNVSRNICKKDRDGNIWKPCHPSLIPSAFILLPEYPILIPEVGCGQSPQKGNKITCLFVMQKDQKRCIDFIQLVILWIEKLIPQRNIRKTDKKSVHILFLSEKSNFYRHKIFYSLIIHFCLLDLYCCFILLRRVINKGKHIKFRNMKIFCVLFVV